MDAFLRHAKVKIKVWVNNVELKDALLLHANMYPRMRPADAVKLVYQNEFGGGHMIKSPEAADKTAQRVCGNRARRHAAAHDTHRQRHGASTA